MDWKKYAILLLPSLLIIIFLAIYLPLGKKQYAIVVPVVFWTVYYIWVYIDRNRKKDNIDHSSSEGIDQ